MMFKAAGENMSNMYCLILGMYHLVYTVSLEKHFNSNWCRGIIHLIRGNARANRDADAIFEQYQKEAGTAEKLIFRRFPLRAVSYIIRQQFIIQLTLIQHKCKSQQPLFHLDWSLPGRGPLLTNYFSQNCRSVNFAIPQYADGGFQRESPTRYFIRITIDMY